MPNSCAQDCNAIDLLHHMDTAGYAYIPEEKYVAR